MQKLVLFDIDGTLLWSDGAGRAAIRDALLAEMGAAGPVERFRFDGKTDPQIVRELLTAAGHSQAASEAHIGMVCARYVELLDVELRSGTREIRVFAGVEALLDAIEIRPDVLMGLLTGNVAQGATLKLQAAGIEPTRFRVGAFGSDSADRSALPAIAANRAATVMGHRPYGDEIVIIGDTPADMTCGRSLDARAIGVGTGAYSVGDLIDAGANAAFEDLSDTAGVLAAISA
jgi:phosphoglycolate phosphatase-like HAD superfamily hydrolase